METAKFTYYKNADGHFVCPECNVVKIRQNTMHYHMKKHTGVYEHVCECGKEFLHKSGLSQHKLQAHPAPDASVWDCPCCNHTSKMKANLMIHIGRKHGSGWIPNFTEAGCSGCKKTFSSVTAYYYHAVKCFTAPNNITEHLKAMDVATV
jgi:hypothetical protein